jgi:acetyltransferase-like isoleucine patch superfamily enzyme
VKNMVASAVYRARQWVSDVADIRSDDDRGRRFRSMGASSRIAFPPGDVYGEQWIRIGDRTLIGSHVTLAVGMPGEEFASDADAIIVIGDRCSLGRGTAIVARRQVVIEDDVMIAPNVYITDHSHSYADVRFPIWQQWPTDATVRIGAGSWLATNVIVLPGTDIGRNVTVAGGSVVRGVVPDYSVVAGAPAKVVRRYVDGEGWDPPLPPDAAAAASWWLTDDNLSPDKG